MSQNLSEIKNQPIRFSDPREAETCNPKCDPVKPLCLLLDSSKDWISFQIKNRSLNEIGSLDLTKDFIFSDDFSDPIDSPVTYNGDIQHNDGVPGTYEGITSGTGDLQFLSLSLVAGKTYFFRLNISDLPAGEIYMQETTSGAESDRASAAGWLEWKHVSDGSPLKVIFNAAIGGKVDDIEAYVFGFALGSFDWIGNESEDQLRTWYCHTPGSTFFLDMYSYIPTIGYRYRVNFRIFNSTAGNVQFAAGGFSENFSANGYYTRWFYASTSANPAFVPSTDFDGCIEVIQFGKQFARHFIGLYDDDNNFVADLSNDVVLIEDSLSCYKELADLNLPAGCYKVCVFDEGNLYGPTNDKLQGFGEFVTATGWSPSPASLGWDIGSGFLHIIGDGQIDADLGPVILPPSGTTCYFLAIGFALNESTTGHVTIVFGGGVVVVDADLTPDSQNQIIVPFTGPFANTIFTIQSGGVGTDIIIDYVRVFVNPACLGAPEPDADYCSQCLNISSNVPCGKQIFAQMDDIIDDQGFNLWRTAYGFKWTSFFKPMLRAVAEFHQADYPDAGDEYINNAGSHKRTAEQLQKRWTFSVAQLDEGSFDALRVIAKADQIGVYTDVIGDPDSGDIYHCPAKDMSPSWPRGIKNNRADADLELQIREKETLFFHNSF